MEIDSMPAGREMDALVAEKVMGIKICRDFKTVNLSDALTHPIGDFRANALPLDYVKEYSTTISAAWEVVEKMGREYGFGDKNGFTLMKRAGEKWYCEFQFPAWMDGEADTAPLAICRAALKAASQP